MSPRRLWSVSLREERGIREMTSIPLTLTDKQIANFCWALNDAASFTVLYELTYSEQPVTPVNLSRTFGADIREVGAVLSRLTRFGVVERRGHSFSATAWASDAMRFLEEEIQTIQLEGVQPSSQNGIFIGRIESIDPSETSLAFGAATTNGAWTASFVNLAPEASVEQNSGSGGGTTDVTPTDLKDIRNETRSQLYK